MKDYSELKQCAEKATQGEWWIDSHGHTLVAHTPEGTKIVFRTDDSMGPATRHAETGNLSHWPNDWDASYIVTANPAAVLELIAEVEGHQGLYDHMKSMREAYGYGSWTEVLTVAEQLKAEVEALRKDAARLDRLEMECEAYGTDVHEGNRWVIDGPFSTVRDAIDAGMGKECGNG